MGEITLSSAWAWLLAACAAIVAIAKAWDIVKKLGRGDVVKGLENTNQKLDNDNHRIKALEEANVITMQTLLAIVNHEIDGNNIQGLKETRQKLNEYLVKR